MSLPANDRRGAAAFRPAHLALRALALAGVGYGAAAYLISTRLCDPLGPRVARVAVVAGCVAAGVVIRIALATRSWRLGLLGAVAFAACVAGWPLVDLMILPACRQALAVP